MANVKQEVWTLFGQSTREVSKVTGILSSKTIHAGSPRPREARASFVFPAKRLEVRSALLVRSFQIKFRRSPLPDKKHTYDGPLLGDSLFLAWFALVLAQFLDFPLFGKVTLVVNSMSGRFLTNARSEIRRPLPMPSNRYPLHRLRLVTMGKGHPCHFMAVWSDLWTIELVGKQWSFH